MSEAIPAMQVEERPFAWGGGPNARDRAGHARKRGPSVPGPANVAASSGNHMQSLGTITSRNNAAGTLFWLMSTPHFAECTSIPSLVNRAPLLWRTLAYLTGLTVLLPPFRRHAVPRRSTKQQGCPKSSSVCRQCSASSCSWCQCGRRLQRQRGCRVSVSWQLARALSTQRCGTNYSIEQSARHIPGACSLCLWRQCTRAECSARAERWGRSRERATADCPDWAEQPKHAARDPGHRQPAAT